ncbi:MAG: hypothetical protein KIS92_11020 [Planctomycetota bacterium]|nr:hypothetical protein [Planctomycetota bacterium]
MSNLHEKRLLKDTEKALADEGFSVSAVDVFDVIRRSTNAAGERHGVKQPSS